MPRFSWFREISITGRFPYLAGLSMGLTVSFSVDEKSQYLRKGQTKLRKVDAKPFLCAQVSLHQFHRFLLRQEENTKKELLKRRLTSRFRTAQALPCNGLRLPDMGGLLAPPVRQIWAPVCHYRHKTLDPLNPYSRCNPCQVYQNSSLAITISREP